MPLVTQSHFTPTWELLMRKALAFGTTAAFLAGLAVAAAPASADTTSATFTLSTGGLSLSVATNPTVNLGGSNVLAVGARTVAAALNSTTVTDSRGLLLSSWKVQVTGSDWVTGAATTTDATDDYTIPKANGNMYVDVADAAALTLSGALGGLVVSQVATAAAPGNLAAVPQGGTAPTLVAGTTASTGTLTYTPTLSVTVPAAAIAGTYSGSVVQTAS